jgi:histidinol dehydrogenase
VVSVKSARHKARRTVLTENALAEAEGLKAHAESVRRRLEPRE